MGGRRRRGCAGCRAGSESGLLLWRREGLAGSCPRLGDQPPALVCTVPTQPMPPPPTAEPGSYDAALAAGAPAAVLQVYGAIQDEGDGDAMATASDERALQAVLAAADAPGRSLCAQPLGLSSPSAVA